MKNKFLTVDEERARYSRLVQVATGLECKLISLVREALTGKSEALAEFQQFIRYAPQPMRERVVARLDQNRGAGQ